jgi:hypothetical protein
MVASYTNPGGSGNRTAIITVSTTATVGGGAVTQLVDGSQANSFWWNNGQSGREVRFDFGTPKWVVGAKWYQDSSGTHGTWKWQGSPDGSAWTDIGATFTLGGTLQVISEPSVNTATYRYYRMLQTAGTTASSSFDREIEFLIDDSVTSLPPTYAQITQASLEMWVTAATLLPSQGLVTQVALEQWAVVTPITSIAQQARVMVMA